ncbi:MAG TPA: lytic transglycosylase domain-containing protein [Polyangiaceae bacterium]
MPRTSSEVSPALHHWLRRPLWGAVAFSLLAGTANADIYKKVEADGTLSFSNTKGDGAQLYARTAKKPKATPFMPADTSPERFHRYDTYIRQAAGLYQIPEALVRAVIKVESNYDPRAVSPANARGLMQLIPETAERMQVRDIHDPRQNIFGGVRYLRILANLFNGDLELTVAAYNAGENAVIRFGGIPPYEETQGYVVKVLGYYRHYRAAPTPAAPPSPTPTAAPAPASTP